MVAEDSREAVSRVAHQMSVQRERFVTELASVTRAQIRPLDHGLEWWICCKPASPRS